MRCCADLRSAHRQWYAAFSDHPKTLNEFIARYEEHDWTTTVRLVHAAEQDSRLKAFIQKRQEKNLGSDTPQQLISV